jgi:hypothetical protein
LHEQIIKAARFGLTDVGIARNLRLDRRTVAAVRRAEGIAPYGRPTTPHEMLAAYLVPQTDGHTGWCGPSNGRGAPTMYDNKNHIQPGRAVFERKHRREAVGPVRPECGHPHCLTASHLTDDVIRLSTRLLLREMRGLRPPWSACPVCGADWNSAGRVRPDLRLYCADCLTRRVQAYRDERKTS